MKYKIGDIVDLRFSGLICSPRRRGPITSIESEKIVFKDELNWGESFEVYKYQLQLVTDPSNPAYEWNKPSLKDLDNEQENI